MANEELIGRRIRVVALPPLDGMAAEAAAALRWTLGRDFTVAGVGRYGHLELPLGPQADRELGGFGNTLWIEREHVEVLADAPAPPRGGPRARRRRE